MKNLDFKNRLHFNEFPPVSTKEWEARIEADLKGKNYKETLRWHSGEDIAPLPFYRKEDLDQLSHEPSPLGGVSGWNICEPIEEKDLKSANEHAILALNNGASGLFLNLPADSLSSKKDLQQLLNNVKIELIVLSFARELSTPAMVNWVCDICLDRGLNEKSVNVLFSLDPFANAVQTGKLAQKSHIEEFAQNLNGSFKSCAVDASVYANSGATIVQQLAFALATGNEYLGMTTELADNLNFNFVTGPNYFLEIAKFRAFKLTWLQVLEEYGLKHPPYLQAETASWNKSRTDAHNNMLRATTEAMSAALGGCNSIIVHRYDNHFAESSGFASRIARNIQLILKEEAYLDKVADPGAGSYYIEMLTDAIAKESWTLFQEIEYKGGFYECLKNGFIQQLISESRDQKISAYKEKQRVLVGVNKYRPEGMKNLNFPEGIPLVKIQNFEAFEFSDGPFLEIQKIDPLNIEAEIQKEGV